VLTVHPSAAAEGAPEPRSGPVWIDLLNATEAETAQVEDHIGLHMPTLDELREIEQSSRQSIENGVLRLSTPVVANADTDHPKLTYVGIVLTQKTMITVRFERLMMIQATAERACGGEVPHPTSAQAFTALLEAFVDRQADLLEIARAELDDLGHAVFRNMGAGAPGPMHASRTMRRKLQTIGHIGERISLIRESMLAVDRAVPFALEVAEDWFKGDLQHRLKAVRKDLDSLSLFEEHLSSKVQFMLDAVLGFINIEQNDIFKVLTIASVVGIFPTLVVGWYGMNFKNMHEYDWAFGYQWGIGWVVVSTLIPLAWFKWRGWM
jgi:magnesium transporter